MWRMGVVQRWGVVNGQEKNRTNEFEVRKRIHLPRLSPPVHGELLIRPIPGGYTRIFPSRKPPIFS